jgi:hypothetical protein
MAELGKSQAGDAASALASLASCCAAHANSGSRKAAALTAAVDAPLRDLVRCAAARDTSTLRESTRAD